MECQRADGGVGESTVCAVKEITTGCVPSKSINAEDENEDVVQEVILALNKVFVSFDFENDRQYKYLLEAWHANPDFDFVFSDVTPSEIQSNDIGKIKAGLTTKIILATHTLVIVGKEANKIHKDSSLIGHRNWINFEVYQSKLYGKKLVAVKLSPLYEDPEELRLAAVSWAFRFTEDEIISALNRT